MFAANSGNNSRGNASAVYKTGPQGKQGLSLQICRRAGLAFNKARAGASVGSLSKPIRIGGPGSERT